MPLGMACIARGDAQLMLTRLHCYSGFTRVAFYSEQGILGVRPMWRTTLIVCVARDDSYGCYLFMLHA